ncbi:MAG TPA: hypothetical protein VMH28_12070 [Candidatus Acidoferrales bacterium]|nr:hypothetical protein [Candidatus Acidoferrales bacterium]
MRPRDTSPEAWKVYLGLIRRMSPEERLQRAFEYSAFVRSFAEAGIRSAHPNATDREVFLLGARRRLGEDLFRRVYASEIEADGSLRTGA